MRVAIWTAVFSLAALSAFADASIAGHWKANLGHDVAINMQVEPNGTWSSETWQNGHKVRQMEGTYTQRPPADHQAGELVFTPNSTAQSTEHATVEHDTYRLRKHGRELDLISNGDKMVFHKTR